MQKIIQQMKRGDERGFTLIELLIVIAIIAILAAIAIPQFAAYRQRAIRAEMVSDARNIATIEEALFSDNQSYYQLDGSTGLTTAGPTNGKQNIRITQGNSVNVTGYPAAYTITVTNLGSGTGNYTLTNDGSAGFGS